MVDITKSDLLDVISKDNLFVKEIPKNFGVNHDKVLRLIVNVSLVH
tara:strand:+ start:207 stop:344 length:138 start_codon:yes stop_codon:yes gene_type:complete